MKRIFSLALIGLAVIFAGCSQVSTGNVGVSRFAGKTNMEELPAGFHVTLLASVDEMTTKEVIFPVRDMKPKSSDNLTIADLDVDIYAKIDPTKVAETTTKYLGDVAEYGDLVQGGGSDLVVGATKITREAREAIYKAAAKLPATTMHTQRTDLAASIQALLQAELDRSDKGVWLITSVNVANLVTDPAIEQSIRAAASRDLEIAAANKDKELKEARGRALIAEAKAEAEANAIISASLTDKLIRLREIEAQKAFAGQGTHTVLMGGNGTGSLVSVGK